MKIPHIFEKIEHGMFVTCKLFEMGFFPVVVFEIYSRRAVLGVVNMNVEVFFSGIINKTIPRHN